MKIKDIPFQAIPQFSDFDKAYVENNSTFQSFYNRPPIAQSFQDQINEKANSYQYKRNLIAQVIEHQYDNVSILNNHFKSKIDRLKDENAFTVVTAHQPSLFTGPLYFIYKIISTIKTASEIESKLDHYNIIPLFIIGGEDHDFEEINHITYRDHQFEWKEEYGGPVGRMSTKGIIEVIRELAPYLNKSYYGKEILSLLKDAYDGQKSLAEATQYFVAQLFKDTPLLVLSMDDINFKRDFVPFIKEEILNEVSHHHVENTQEQLTDIGYSPQAHARSINFFYIHDGLRSRIVTKDDQYLILGSEMQFSRKEMENEIEVHPERFSPNVIMRPLYQEFILPNVAYIGGGGELAYWMERKSQFEHFGISFPILMRRHSATLINTTIANKIDSFEWGIHHWFKEYDRLVDRFLTNHHENEINFSTYYAQVHDLFDELRNQLKSVDPTLDYSAEAGRSDTLAIVERLRTKLKRALKTKEEIQLNRIGSIQDAILPNGNLQERTHNFIQYYEQYGPALFEMISEAFTPFDIQMKMIIAP